ncbi:MAG TPA: hypothetical protein VN969_42645 [Streptosporangiaceae bacterium]|nr:hypothetical protein [Streptosporangiaceae bacterium]
MTRLKFPGPATEETWVTGSAGDPLLVVMAQPSSSLAAQIRDLLSVLPSPRPSRNRSCASTTAAGPPPCSPASPTPGSTCSSMLVAGRDLAARGSCGPQPRR